MNRLFLQVVLYTLLTVMYALSINAYAAEHQETTTTKNTKQKVSADDDCIHPPPIALPKQHWMESLHETVSESVFQSAVWFDNFFMDENSEQQNPKTTARIRLGWEPKARDWDEFDTRFRVKVKLPHFKNKVDLIFSDEEESEQSQLPLESLDSRSGSRDDDFAAAVRFTHRKNKNRLFESRIGISGGDIFLKAKHKRRITWNDSHSFLYEPSVYYFIDDGLGARLLLEYDYQYNDKNQLRFNYSMRGSESFSGIRWKHGFYHLRQIDQHSASITAIQIEGERNGPRGLIVDEYRFSYRYRFNALREWLFFEVEPFLEWPENENYTTTPGLALRVEGYFSRE